jgi:hypothetical protein
MKIKILKKEEEEDFVKDRSFSYTNWCIFLKIYLANKSVNLMKLHF